MIQARSRGFARVVKNNNEKNFSFIPMTVGLLLKLAASKK